MEAPTQPERLIRNRRIATMVVMGTGVLTAVTLWRTFFPVPHQSHWLLPLRFLLPGRADIAVNVAFYLYLLWFVIFRFFRKSQGKEQILIAGYCPLVFLNPFKYLVSTAGGNLFQSLQLIGMIMAFVAALLILKDAPATDDTRHNTSIFG
jgi:hypothetical protein